MTSMILCESIHSKPSDSLIHIVLIDNQSPLEQANSDGSKKKLGQKVPYPKKSL
jgi:hypothetical protein